MRNVVVLPQPEGPTITVNLVGRHCEIQVDDRGRAIPVRLAD
jgi:hypothetical protein